MATSFDSRRGYLDRADVRDRLKVMAGDKTRDDQVRVWIYGGCATR